MSFHPGMLGQRVDENPYMYRTCGAATGGHKGLGYMITDGKEIISYSAWQKQFSSKLVKIENGTFNLLSFLFVFARRSFRAGIQLEVFSRFLLPRLHPATRYVFPRFSPPLSRVHLDVSPCFHP